jgi:hypothetical protein
MNAVAVAPVPVMLVNVTRRYAHAASIVAPLVAVVVPLTVNALAAIQFTLSLLTCTVAVTETDPVPARFTCTEMRPPHGRTLSVETFVVALTDPVDHFNCWDCTWNGIGYSPILASAARVDRPKDFVDPTFFPTDFANGLTTVDFGASSSNGCHPRGGGTIFTNSAHFGTGCFFHFNDPSGFRRWFPSSSRNGR